MNKEELARFIDNTLLKPIVTPTDVRKFCEESKEASVGTVFVNSAWTPLAYSILKGSKTKIGCSISFPLGASSSEIKAFETSWCLKNGANEVDMVMNIGAFLAGDYEFVKNDIRIVKRAIIDNCDHGKEMPLLKVIIEVCYLSDEQIYKASQLVKEAGADFVKTSTGFAEGGATVKAVKIMRDAVGADFGVKAAGGIRDLHTALSMLEAGANRIGTSSGVKILSELSES